MTGYLLPGLIGLLLGLTLRWTGLASPDGLRHALGLRRSYAVRSALYAVGLAMALTALLCWLAVIDVDRIAVLPLNGGVLMAGAVFGIASGLCGFTPLTAFAGAGGAAPGRGGHALEALCTLAGCFLGVLVLPGLSGLFAGLSALPPLSATTLFQVTLDEPFLLGGGFLGQACAGLVLALTAICIPSPRAVVLSEEAVLGQIEATSPAEEAPADEEAAVSADALPSDEEGSAPAEVPPPEDAPGDTFVAILPGEEPLVVDTVMPEADEPSAGLPDESAPSEEITDASAEADQPADIPDESGDEPTESDD